MADFFSGLPLLTQHLDQVAWAVVLYFASRDGARFLSHDESSSTAAAKAA